MSVMMSGGVMTAANSMIPLIVFLFDQLSVPSERQVLAIADVLFKTTFLENWGSGIGRIMDALSRGEPSRTRIQPKCLFRVGDIQKEHHTTVQPYNPHNPTS